jgi:hypothetical protein
MLTATLDGLLETREDFTRLQTTLEATLNGQNTAKMGPLLLGITGREETRRVSSPLFQVYRKNRSKMAPNRK